MVLGVPVATGANETALPEGLREKASGFRDLAGRISGLPDAQVAHPLLRQCLGPAKVQHLLRALPAHLTAALAASISDT